VRRSVFISYGHEPADERAAAWVAEVLRASGHEVWRDDLLQERSGVALNAEIAEAIAARSHFIFVQSAMSLSSRYCQAEIAYALGRGKPLVCIELEPTVAGAMPPALLPLLGRAETTALFHGVTPDAWIARLAEAASRAGLVLRHESIDPLKLSPYAYIVRPPYLRLKGSNAAAWASAQARLIEAQALAPTNGYTALSLALLRTFLGEAASAQADAEMALRHLPSVADAYYAAALAACAKQAPDRRAKPEADAILARLATGRTMEHAGVHLWLLAALVTDHFYERRYLPSPVTPAALIEEGLARGAPNAEECQRVWDLEGKKLNAPLWSLAAQRMGFEI
jgi:hypothetical protein